MEINYKHSIVICLVGIVFIAIGSIGRQYWTVRIAGVIIVMAGLISLGNRIYQRIKEKRALKL